MLWREAIRRLWRAPDKPVRIYPQFLPSIEGRAGIVAEPKFDGHRGVLLVDDKISAYSRHFSPLPIDRNLLDEFRMLGFPSGTAIDVEWMGRRAGCGRESLVLLDCLYMGWEWQGNKDLLTRTAPFTTTTPNIKTPERRFSDFLGFFESQIGNPNTALTEGIVIKTVAARLIGNPTKSAENPLWWKLKWRDGPDGKQIIYRRKRETSVLS